MTPPHFSTAVYTHGVQLVGLVQKQLGLIGSRQDALTLRKVKVHYAQ